jgi:hypothetical protein
MRSLTLTWSDETSAQAFEALAQRTSKGRWTTDDEEEAMRLLVAAQVHAVPTLRDEAVWPSPSS